MIIYLKNPNALGFDFKNFLLLNNLLRYILLVIL